MVLGIALPESSYLACDVHSHMYRIFCLRRICFHPAAAAWCRRNTGRWTQEEHENFLKGIQQFGRNWDAIHELYVTSRSETQIRTHAQKYFQKVDRGLSFPEEVCVGDCVFFT